MDRNLILRTLSAFCALIILLSTTYFFGIQGLALVAAFVILVGIYEYAKMMFTQLPAIFYFFLIYTCCLLPVAVYSAQTHIYIAPISFLVFTIFSLFYHRSNPSVDDQFQTILKLIMGFIYTLILPSYLLIILDPFSSFAGQKLSLPFITTVLAITFASDTFAYTFGRLFGKNKVLPVISPNKTKAGSVGGLIAACLVACFLIPYFGINKSIFASLIIGFTCGISAQFGDFFASLLKRVAKVKDTGKIMPGHGGVIDRLDGVYFVAPVFYTLYTLFNYLNLN